MADSRKGFIVELTGVLSGYDTRSVQQVAQDIQKQFSKVGTFKFDKKDINEARKYYASLWKDLATLQNQYNTSVANGSTDMQLAYKRAMDVIKFEIEDMARAAKNATDKAISTPQSRYWAKAKEEAEKGAKYLIARLKEVKKEKDKLEKDKKSHSFLSGFKDALMGTNGPLNAFAAGTQAAQMSLRLMSEALRKAYNDIKELNKVMTDVQMVAGTTTEETAKMFNEYNDIARELDVTTKSVAEGANTWIRQGKTQAETIELLKASTVQATLAGMDYEQSSKLLTAALNGYKMEASEAMHVVDALTAIDFVAATSVEELSEAMQKTANSARLAGVDFETLAAYIAAVIDTSQQAPEVVGTAFKTLFARMANVKAGVDFDEEGEAINDVEKVLNKFDIQLRENSGTFREFDDVLEDVHDKWIELGEAGQSVAQGQIATALGMSRQQEIFKVLMENWDKVTEYANVALESSGSAMERYKVYQESIQARLNELQAAWEKLITSEYVDMAIKSVIDLGAALLDLGSVLKPVIDLLSIFVTLIAKTVEFLANPLDFFPTALERTEDTISNTNSKLTELEEEIDILEQKKLDGILDEYGLTVLEKYKEEARRLKKEIIELESKKNELERQNIGTIDYQAPMSTLTTTNITAGNAVNVYNQIQKELDDIKGKYDAIKDSTNEYAKNTANAYAEQIYKLEQNKEQLEELLSVHAEYLISLDENGTILTDNEKKLVEFTRANSLLASQTEKVVEAENASYDISSFLNNTYTGLAKSIEGIDNAFSVVNDALTEYNNNGQISIQTVAALIAENSDFINAVEIVNGEIKLNIDYLKEGVKKEKEAAIARARHSKTIIVTKKAEAKANYEAARSWALYYAAQADWSKAREQIEILNQINSEIVEYNRSLSDLDKEIAIIERYDPFSSINTSGSAAVDNIKDVGDAADDTTDKLREIQDLFNAYVDAITDQIDKEIDALEKDKDYWEEYYDDKIDAIKEVEEEIDQQTEAEEKLLAIEKARANLAKANQEVVRIYVRGKGFIYQQNLEAVAAAQEELDILLKEWDNYQKKLELEQQVKNFEDAKDATIKNIEEEIEKLEDLKDKWSESLDIQDAINKYDGLLDDIKKFENMSYQERLDALEEFVDEYNRLTSKLQSGTSSSSSSGKGKDDKDKYSSSSSNKHWDGIVSGGGAWYNPDTYTREEAEKKETERTGKTQAERESRYAKGTVSAPRTSLSTVGEEGPELRVVNKGDGIIPADMTRNLMEWGKFNPMNLLSKIPGFNRDKSSQVYSFSFDKLVLPSVNDAAGFINALKSESKRLAVQVQSERV